MAVLIGMSQDVKGKSVEIAAEEISIGRKSDNTIPVDNPTVSGHHCVVVKQDQTYLLRDLGSTNGTRVNSQDITEARLKPKDIVQVGSVEFMFDAAPGEVISEESHSDTMVEVAPGPAAAPESFGSVSPFGARNTESRGMWFLVIAGIGILALAVVVFFFFKLITES